MSSRRRSNASGEGRTTDGATLYLCRQGPTWVVVIESPASRVPCVSATRAPTPTTRGPSSSPWRARACPGAAIVSTDGALESADYEWRLEVRGVEAHEGDLGLAIHHALSAGAPRHVKRIPQRGARRRCHWGLAPVSGRPRSF